MVFQVSREVFVGWIVDPEPPANQIADRLGLKFASGSYHDSSAADLATTEDLGSRCAHNRGVLVHERTLHTVPP